MEKIKFNELGFNKKILDAIDSMGFEEPSQIQAEAIPEILKGNDIIGQAQTGTGKTLAYGAPMLNNITPGKKVTALILTPTRELAIQVNEELTRIAKYQRLNLLPIYGGQPIDRQIRSLRRGIDIVVGTPGRVIDHINRGTLDLLDIQFLILDEADEMLNMGFIDDMEEIIKNTNPDRQTLLFSATMPDQIKKLATRYMKKDSKHITIAKNTVTVEKIKQYYYEIKHKDRFETLCRILDVDEPSSALIFCKTKRGVDELVEWMKGRGYNVEGMHGDMAQNQRISTLRKFKEGNLDFLVATDVAARGIDVEDIAIVINYDLPQDTESYVHRIGRTGRANKEGTAYSLVTPKEYMMLKQIEKYTKSKIKRKEIPTIDEIFETKYKSIINTIKESLEKDDYKDFIPVATELDEEYNLVDVAATLMKMYFSRELSFDYKDNKIGGSDNVRLFLSVGRLDKIDPKKMLKFISDNTDLDTGAIGDMDILEKFTFIDVPDIFVDTILKKVSGKKFNGRRVNIEIAKGKSK